MSSHRHANYLFAALLAAGSALAFPAFGKIISQKDAVEADNITVEFDGRGGGTVSVSGCVGCPMLLHMDQSTRFFLKHRAIGETGIRASSGKSGTVVYDKGTHQALKVYW